MKYRKIAIATSLALAFVGGMESNRAFAATDNGSFESSNVPGGGYKYSSDIPVSALPSGADNVVAAPWSFSGASGIGTNGSAWGGAALDGSSFAFLQGVSSISQSFSGLSGLYSISFSLAQRTNFGVVGEQAINVYLDGQQLSLAGQNQTYIRPSIFGDNNQYGGWTSYAFTRMSSLSGTHTLTFSGLGNGSDDTTVFLDSVNVTSPVPEPDTAAMLLAGFGLVGFIARRRRI